MARTKGSKGFNNRYKIPEMIKKVHEYTEKTQLPILKEVCFLNGWDYDYMLELQRKYPLLRAETKRLLEKKEIQLEKALASGANNTGMIFMLKQLGWKDNPEPLVINNTIQNNQGGNRSEALRKMSTETLEQLENIYKEIDEQEKDDKSDD